jgi:hypothetical protein
MTSKARHSGSSHSQTNSRVTASGSPLAHERARNPRTCATSASFAYRRSSQRSSADSARGPSASASAKWELGRDDRFLERTFDRQDPDAALPSVFDDRVG